MRAQLHVQTCELAEPARAARTLAARLVRDCPRQRPVTLAIMALGPHPGLTPTPWVLDGVLAALVESERTPVQLLTLGDHETAEALLRKCGHASGNARELVERPSRDRKVGLRRVPGVAAFSLPREVVGSSLLIVSPMCWMGDADLDPAGLTGPFATALAALARAHGAQAPRPSGRRKGLLPTLARGDAQPGLSEAGHAWLGAGFASASLLMDASWLALVDGRDPQPAPRNLARRGKQAGRALRPLAELESPARVLGLADLARLDLGTLLDCDAWLSYAIGLDARVPAEAPSFSQSPGPWPHPQLLTRPASGQPSKTRSGGRRLADRAIVGIRQAAQARRDTGTALPPRVPGAFAQLWSERWYGGHARGVLR